MAEIALFFWLFVLTVVSVRSFIVIFDRVTKLERRVEKDASVLRFKLRGIL